MEKILVSACFLGELVRYDGKANPIANKAFRLLKTQGRLISICPEMSGGLSVPRAPAEVIDSKSDNNIKVFTITEEDVTKAFNDGAHAALALCQKYNIRYALLKESSPSCGSATIYDGSFKQQKIEGEGITTRLLRANGIAVFSELTFEQLLKQIN